MICRVCLIEADCPLRIFDNNGEQLHIADILERHFWFKPLVPNDSISNVICRGCWSKVNEFHQFYLIVEQAHQAFSTSGAFVATDEGVKREDDSEYSHLEANVEVNIKLEDEVENVWHNEDMQLEEVQNPLYEPEVLESSVAMSTTNLQTILKPPQESDKLITDSDASNSTENDCSETSLKRRCPRTTSNKSLKRTRKAKSSDEVKVVKERRKHQKRQMMITENDDEIVKKHIPMGCDLCAFVGSDFISISVHFREKHTDMKPYIVCCDRKLKKRFQIVQHAYKHEDPDFFKCTECHKVFANNNILRHHIMATHAPDEDLRYACDQCSRRFPRQYLLDLHRPSHIPIEERKFACEQCPQSKPFASEHLLQIHISMRHKRATNVCHVCAKEIRDNQSFEKHVRLHFEDSGPRVKCPRPDCDRWLKDEDNLKQHLRRHNDNGQIFKCDQCGKVCKNRRSLSSHISYAHTTEVFSCDECQKTFKKAISLKEHMAQHTGESLYKCPFCERTFNSNANMHSHKKKMHPVEWDIWRKTKRGSAQKLITSTLRTQPLEADTKAKPNLLQ